MKVLRGRPTLKVLRSRPSLKVFRVKPSVKVLRDRPSPDSRVRMGHYATSMAQCVSVGTRLFSIHDCPRIFVSECNQPD